MGFEPFGSGGRYDFWLSIGPCDLHITRQAEATLVEAFPVCSDGVGSPVGKLTIFNDDVAPLAA